MRQLILVISRPHLYNITINSEVLSRFGSPYVEGNEQVSKREKEEVNI